MDSGKLDQSNLSKDYEFATCVRLQRHGGRMNIRAGLVRIWILLSLAVVIVTTLVIFRPVSDWVRFHGTIGIKISKDDISEEFRLNSSFSELTEAEKSLLVQRVIYLLDVNDKDMRTCLEALTFLDKKLAEAKASGDTQSAASISNVMKFFDTDSGSDIKLSLMPWEVYTLQKYLPEYSDLGYDDIKEKVENKSKTCRQAKVGSTPVAEKLEQIAKEAYRGTRTSEVGQILMPTLVGCGLICILWLILYAGFWVATGFQSKR